MEEILKANIVRGKKWSGIRDKAGFKGDDKNVEWIDAQASIVEDIKAYKDSLEQVKETKSKKGK